MSYTNRDFNPSKDTRGDDLKSVAEAFAVLVANTCPDGPLKDKALIDIQSASMFSVKSLFS